MEQLREYKTRDEAQRAGFDDFCDAHQIPYYNECPLCVNNITPEKKFISIDQQIKELEDKKIFLLKEEETKKRNELFEKLNNEYVGKVKCSIFKGKNNHSFTAYYYKKIVMKDNKIFIAHEYVHVNINFQKGWNQYSTQFKKINIGDYGSEFNDIIDREMFSHKKELTISQFKILANACKSFGDKEFITILTNCEANRENFGYSTRNVISIGSLDIGKVCFFK